MNELNNKKLDELEGIGMDREEVVPVKDKVVKLKPSPSNDDLKAWIIAKSDAMNIPALAAYFSVEEDVIKQALANK
jgi:hypothetical protein